MLSGSYLTLYNKLKKILPADRLISDELRRIAIGTDGSFYRLIPQLIVVVKNENEIQKVIQFCHELKLPLTIRGAGTSLSGQGVTDSVLVVLDQSEWNKMSLSNDQTEITLQPAVIGGKANRFLAQYNKKIGPDPASINAAQVGGIVANNSSGMTSGTRYNSYNTLKALRIIFSDGTVLDTHDEQSRREFSNLRKNEIEKLNNIRQRILDNEEIYEKITTKFAIKNTTGYSVNALIDFEDPVDIIAHLMVGSEGTLGFISEISLKTVDDPPNKATALILFPDIVTACRAIPLLKQCPVAAAELMDRASLRSVEDNPVMPDYLKTLDANVTALLVETRADNDQQLDQNILKIISKFKDYPLVKPISFTKDSKEIAALWAVRKGLFPSVCKNRNKGTSVIIEDIAVPYDSLADTLYELKKLFLIYDYSDAIIWGHAFDGNIHFVLIQDFSVPDELQRYEKFMDELVKLVVDKYNGSLKAEHGTGRNMAPFVQREWGDSIYDIMYEIKNILDPENLFNPGVIINDDPKLHLKNLKEMPAAQDIIDMCIECGFCEVNCVSHNLTFSPRQRIIAYREMSKRKATEPNPKLPAEFNKIFEYHADLTCATDGLCAISCPVAIDTGQFVKEIRREKRPAIQKNLARFIAGHMQGITVFTRLGLKKVYIFKRILGETLLGFFAGLARKISAGKIPQWTPWLPKGAPKTLYQNNTNGKLEKSVVYFPTCINRTLGPGAKNPYKTDLVNTVEKLLYKAGYNVIYPDKIKQLCCGMPFSSKGFPETGDHKTAELKEELLKATENGKWPVLLDMSSCTYRLLEKNLNENLTIYEPVQFCLEQLIPNLKITKTYEKIALHHVCSSTKMEMEEKYEQLAGMLSEHLAVAEMNCCGFAGDLGFRHPELNKHGLKGVKQQLTDCSAGYSTNLPCEIGLSTHTGISFQSIFYLLDKCSEQKYKAD